jgi:hypothetical protein
VSSNGTAPHPPTATDDGPLAVLRTTPENVHLFRGYGPLVVGIILFVLMVTLAPTVAPEHTVERPVGGTTTTTATTLPPATEMTP